MTIVVCNLPRLGLGNQLFPLLKAQVFASLNNLPVIVTGGVQLKIGPYLRREKSKRNYHGYFTFQQGWFNEVMLRVKVWQMRNLSVVKEPDVRSLETIPANTKFDFREIPHWSDYFRFLRDNRSLVQQLFWNLLNADYKKIILHKPRPMIALHVRMGDYRPLREGEDFSKVGTVRTPESYFIDIIHRIRRIAGKTLPVSIFSDGFKSELQALLELPEVNLVEGNEDIVDLLLFSRSRLLVTSAGSTFSGWAAFLSESPVIMHPDHIHQPIRIPGKEASLYEGPLNETNSALTDYIKSLSADSAD